MNYQMWQCQLRVLTSSVLIKLFACYLISLGLIPTYDICQDKTKKQWINLPPKDDEDLQQFISAQRQVFIVKHHQVLFIGLGWVAPMEQKCFEHLLEVICEGTVSDTNKDKCPLLTINGKDSFGKMFIILRAFLPNERALVFRWIFTTVLSTLFPCISYPK